MNTQYKEPLEKYHPNIHRKYAIMDRKIVWYGSVNLLRYGNAQESMIRIESSSIADELVKSVESFRFLFQEN
jgi:hypothetical protein